MRKYIFGMLASTLLLASGCYESPTEPNPDVEGNLPIVTTDSLVDNLGLMAVFSGTVVSDGGNKAMRDNGFVVSKGSIPSLQSPDALVGGMVAPKEGRYEVTVSGLETSTKYYYRAFAQNGKGVSYGEVGSFTTLQSALFRTPYATDFSPEKPVYTRGGWVLDKYKGTEDSGQDTLWYYDFEKEWGVANAGWSIAAKYHGEPLKIISPLIGVATGDTLQFTFVPRLFGATTMKVKLYITNNVDSLGDPLTTFDQVGYPSNRTMYGHYEELSDYEGQEVYVVLVMEEGDWVLFHFAVANTINQNTLFPPKQSGNASMHEFTWNVPWRL